MRQIFAIFILLFMQMVQAQNEILAPVLVDGQQIAVALEQTTSDSSVLDKLREALKEDAMKEHAQSQKDGWFKSANHRFAPESITFFLATGLVIYETAWGKSHGDPVAMERHILSLKDPIASMSFYAFMQANGFYMNKKSKGLPASMDQGTRAQMMRRFSYGGMVWGSLASSLISDVFSPFKPCLDKMFSSDYRNENHLQERCEKDLSASFAQWNLRNKFGQYAPQIISLILSQKASEFATTLISNLAGGVSNTSSRIAKSELATKYLVNDVTKKLVFKISAVDAVMTFVPGKGPVMVLRWLGKLVQFTGFMYIDHMLSTSVFRGFNNAWRPTSFAFDAIKIDRLWNTADRLNWDDSNQDAYKLECPVQTPNCLSIADFPKEIANFSTQTQQWREHLNAGNEQDLSGWLELTKKILNQVSLAHSYYQIYTKSLFETLNTGYRIQNNEIEAQAILNYSRFPLRQLPLYGVAISNSLKPKIPVRDQNLLSPQNLELYQLDHIKNIVNSVKLPASLEKYQVSWLSFVSNFLSGDINKVGLALVEMNSIVGIYGKERQAKSGFYGELNYTKFLSLVRNEIGNPHPILYDGAGLAQAFSDNSAYLETAREANFNWGGRTYAFNKDADYLTYQMVCGPEKGELSENLLFTDNFVPPRIVKNGSKPLQICNQLGSLVTSNSLYGMKLADEVTGKTSAGIIDYISENMNRSVLGDFKNQKDQKQFDSWWNTNVKESINPRMHQFDEKYKILTSKTKDTLLGENASDQTYLDFFKTKGLQAIDVLNRSKYLPKNISETFKFELEFYFDILQSVSQNHAGLVEKNVSLSKVVNNSKDLNSQGVYGKRVADLTVLKQLFNLYFVKFRANEITFSDYIEYSKKIRDQIDLVKSNLVEDKKPAEGESQKSTDLVRIDSKKFPVKHASAVAAIEGLSLVESEMRRFLRMKLLLSQTLEIDAHEFMSDVNGTDNSQKNLMKVRSSSPRGG